MSTLRYDQVLYPSVTNAGCHCRRHEAVARLFGVEATLLANARVLEVGCGDGWNLFPQAEQYPDARFVGFDYAQRPIEIGQQVVAELGLSNVKLLCADIMQLGDELGQFDYVVAHGFYSWVPEPVQEKFLALLDQWLAPNGVVYISYNTLPGWRTRQTARDLMRMQSSDATSAEGMIAAARDTFQFLAANATLPEYRALLEREYDMVRHRPDGYLFHDHLAEINRAYYFRDMFQTMRESGLQFLGETELATMYPADVSPAARERLSQLPLEESEQMLDFLRNREFRATLFCKADVEFDRQVNPARMMPFHASMAAATNCSRDTVSAEEPLTFQSGGREMELPDPLWQAVVLELTALHPAGSRCEQLLAGARERLTTAGLALPDEQAIAHHGLTVVWHLATMGLVELSIHPPSIAAEVPSYPTAARTARYQAEHGASHASNQLHRSVWLEPIMRRVLALCDGQRISTEIIDLVAREIEAGEIKGTAPEMSQMQVAAVLEALVTEGLLIEGAE